ncbi:MAG: hypothetical protein FIB07_00195 [Candidatus Methanoperedens sp.]|nr:hypothetical protein [Candidatus Methanoperedens sp.]
MLETSEERVKLLKSGISAKKIEQLYITKNDIKILSVPVLFETVEIHQEIEGNGFFCELTPEYVNA